jgi:hypothetical protein
MRKSAIKIIIIFILLADLGYSFLQHYKMPLDGDLAEVVLPSPGSAYYDVLKNPSGLYVVRNDTSYANPNRFFAHWTTSYYYKNVPLVLQKIAEPITSVYLSGAIIKILIQFLLIYLLSLLISGSCNLFDINLLLAALIVTPLFQTFGYNRYMGIIDKSVTYLFFYGLPLCFLIVFYSPFFLQFYHNRKVKLTLPVKLFFFFLIVYLTLHGPLNPGIILIVSLLVFIKSIIENFTRLEKLVFFKRIWVSICQIPNDILLYFSSISIFSLYSLYIGKYNLLAELSHISIWERYAKIPEGLFFIIFGKLGFPILLLVILINNYLIKKNFYFDKGKKILVVLRFIGLFSFLYVLLLPLGGYRPYRENIIRYDTFLPITLALIFYFGLTSFYLIQQTNGKLKKIYIGFLFTVLLIFTNADRIDTSKHDCEKNALVELSISKDQIVFFDYDCKIMSWHEILDYKKSDRNTDLLLHWNIINTKKYYYQE